MQRQWIRARQLRNNATDAERHLWRFHRREQFADYKFRRQFPIGVYIVDFACISARLMLELDSGQHLDAQSCDNTRTRAIELCGYRVLRFWNGDVLLRTDAVLEEILQCFGADRRAPLSKRDTDLVTHLVDERPLAEVRARPGCEGRSEKT